MQLSCFLSLLWSGVTRSFIFSRWEENCRRLLWRKIKPRFFFLDLFIMETFHRTKRNTIISRNQVNELNTSVNTSYIRKIARNVKFSAVEYLVISRCKEITAFSFFYFSFFFLSFRSLFLLPTRNVLEYTLWV